MSADHDQGCERTAPPQRDTVPFFVNSCVSKSNFGESVAEVLRPVPFTEGRRRDRTDTYVLFRYFIGPGLEEFERRLYFERIEKLVNGNVSRHIHLSVRLLAITYEFSAASCYRNFNDYVVSICFRC